MSPLLLKPNRILPHEEKRRETDQHNYHIGRPTNRGSISRQRGNICLFSREPYGPWGPPSFLRGGCRRSSFLSLKRPRGGGGEATTCLHPLSSLRMCGPTPPLPNIRYYTAVGSAQTTSHVAA